MIRSAARLGRQLLRGLSFALVILVAAGGWVLGSFSAAPAAASPSVSVVPLPDNAGSISTYDYRGDFARPPPVLSDAATPSGPAAERGRVRRASSGLEVLTYTPSSAGGGARFVANSAGDFLDTTRIAIPEGKFGYLLSNPSKSGVFSDSMGFTQGTLGPALRGHLVDNFGTATRSVPMVGGGTKFSVTGPLTGPSGQKWNITTAWGVDPDGTIRLITATP